jgi:hypothetical protein
MAAILASFALVGTSGAFADGDPASDVLVNMSLFNPIDSGIPFATVDRLEGMLALSAKDGFPIRVAMINSASDLGTVTGLWGKPGLYATYLWTELSDLYRGQILVVMPSGFGLAGPPRGRYAVSEAEANVRALSAGRGVSLATAAMSAVPLLARAAGRTVPAANDLELVSRPTGSSRTPLSAWLALAFGALLIVVCWRASLKARPLSFSREPRA